jgi:tetratricopeptide (TPR) repeat protein
MNQTLRPWRVFRILIPFLPIIVPAMLCLGQGDLPAQGGSAQAILLEKKIPALMSAASIPGLSPELAQEMLRAQVKLDETCSNCLAAKPPQLSQSLSWGLGWGLEKNEKGEYFWHWGDNRIFRCFVMASRGSRSGLVMFTNSVNGLSIADEMVRSVIPGVHPAMAWVKYDQYDSPLMRFTFAVLRNGPDSAIQQYRSASNTNGGARPFREDGINGLGYQLLRAKRVEDAIRVFQLNVELYPESWNVYDSLGEAYLNHGDKDLAIKNYRRSVDLNPANSGGIQKLKELDPNK